MAIFSCKNKQINAVNSYTTTDTIKGVELNEFINHYTVYQKIVIWGSYDGVNYYCQDTVYSKDGEIVIYKGRKSKQY